VKRTYRSALAAVLAGVALLATPTAAHAGSPPLEAPAEALQAALRCSPDLASAAGTPVLLVPGTFTTAEEAYSWGYQRVLRATGRPVCTVDLPERATMDLQISAEYVVYAIRSMVTAGGRRIDVIGHSQGGMLATWALRFWSDLPSKVDDLVTLGSPLAGTTFVDTVLCPGEQCPDIGWQMKPGSHWIGALNRHPLPETVSVTTIGTHNDELVWPAPTATGFAGATNLMVQQLCPSRPVGHLGLLWDAATYALVTDALDHDGTADLDRISHSACWQTTYPGIDYLAMSQLLITVGVFVDKLLTLPRTVAEPPLRDYATVG